MRLTHPARLEYISDVLLSSDAGVSIVLSIAGAFKTDLRVRPIAACRTAQRNVGFITVLRLSGAKSGSRIAAHSDGALRSPLCRLKGSRLKAPGVAGRFLPRLLRQEIDANHEPVTDGEVVSSIQLTLADPILESRAYRPSVMFERRIDVRHAPHPSHHRSWPFNHAELELPFSRYWTGTLRNGGLTSRGNRGPALLEHAYPNRIAATATVSIFMPAHEHPWLPNSEASCYCALVYCGSPNRGHTRNNFCSEPRCSLGDPRRL